MIEGHRLRCINRAYRSIAKAEAHLRSKEARAAAGELRADFASETLTMAELGSQAERGVPQTAPSVPAPGGPRQGSVKQKRVSKRYRKLFGGSRMPAEFRQPKRTVSPLVDEPPPPAPTSIYRRKT